MEKPIRGRIVTILFRAFFSFLFVLVCAAGWLCYLFNVVPQRSYLAATFGIEPVQSLVDQNKNGIDDYTDFLHGAKVDAQNHPQYDGRYWEEGYPPESMGVCTDVIWRAFREAGYDLRAMVDQDITAYPEDYPWIITPDSAIDFRRVKNLAVFFERYAQSLSTDPKDIGEWQPGDIILFRDNKHIGIVSDLRTRRGRAYIIHSGGFPQFRREEDYLKRATVSAHYRFDASTVASEMLICWESPSDL